MSQFMIPGVSVNALLILAYDSTIYHMGVVFDRKRLLST